MDAMPAIALQLKWNDISASVHAAGLPYSPDVVSDLMSQVGRGFRQMLKDASEYDFEADPDEVEDYIETSLEQLKLMFGIESEEPGEEVTDE